MTRADLLTALLLERFTPRPRPGRLLDGVRVEVGADHELLCAQRRRELLAACENDEEGAA